MAFPRIRQAVQNVRGNRQDRQQARHDRGGGLGQRGIMPNIFPGKDFRGQGQPQQGRKRDGSGLKPPYDKFTRQQLLDNGWTNEQIDIIASDWSTRDLLEAGYDIDTIVKYRPEVKEGLPNLDDKTHPGDERPLLTVPEGNQDPPGGEFVGEGGGVAITKEPTVEDTSLLGELERDPRTTLSPADPEFSQPSQPTQPPQSQFPRQEEGPTEEGPIHQRWREGGQRKSDQERAVEAQQQGLSEVPMEEPSPAAPESTWPEGGLGGALGRSIGEMIYGSKNEELKKPASPDEIPSESKWPGDQQNIPGGEGPIHQKWRGSEEIPASGSNRYSQRVLDLAKAEDIPWHQASARVVNDVIKQGGTRDEGERAAMSDSQIPGDAGPQIPPPEQESMIDPNSPGMKMVRRIGEWWNAPSGDNTSAPARSIPHPSTVTAPGKDKIKARMKKELGYQQGKKGENERVRQDPRYQAWDVDGSGKLSRREQELAWIQMHSQGHPSLSEFIKYRNSEYLDSQKGKK